MTVWQRSHTELDGYVTVCTIFNEVENLMISITNQVVSF